MSDAGNVVNFPRPAGAMPPGGPMPPGAPQMPPGMAGMAGPPQGPMAAGPMRPPPGPMPGPPQPPTPIGPAGAPAAGAGLPHPAVMPMPSPAVPPGMMLNPAFQQWLMISQLWHAEDQRRKRQFQAATMLIRHDVCSSYKIDIEADSTVAADEMAEKQARTEFLQAILPMLQLLIPQAQQNPGSVPLIHALVMFGVRAFPSARSLEQEFEEAFRTLISTPAPPPPPKGNVKTPQEIQAEQQETAGNQQIDQQKNQIAAAQVQVAQQKNAIDMYKAYLTAQGSRQSQQQDAYLRAAELAQQGQDLEGRQQLERARLTHLVTRDSMGLV